ncbi:MAG: Trk system potassium transporter TrkA [Spirochaetota bacterium]
MRIIIAGAGDVGFHLARLLVKEKQEITLIDLDSEKLKYASEHIDVVTVKGHSISYAILEEANIDGADLLIAVTSSEETNIATAIIAKRLGAKKTVARVSNVEFLQSREKLDLKTLGIDEIISPESLATREIKRLLREVAITDTFDFDSGLLTLVGITIDQECLLYGKNQKESSQEFNQDENFTAVAILRNNRTLIPRGDTRFELNDHAYFICQKEGVERVIELTRKKRTAIRNVMILGGSKIGFHAAKKLSSTYNIKLVESDRDKCNELSDELENTLILNADGTNIEILKEEGLEEMDAFIAVTGNSETNIISCLVAKNLGVRKTISLVENIDYIHLSQSIGVDTMINKKLIAANFILRYLRQGGVISMIGIPGVNAEIIEYEVKPNSKLLSGQLKNINFPRNAIVGGVIRDGRGQTAMGDFEFRPGDRVVVLSKPGDISKVEKFFDEV